MFYLGQRVVCVRGHTSCNGMELFEGQEYIIQGIDKCNCSDLVFVGHYGDMFGVSECIKCGYIHNHAGEWWHYADRFVAIEDYEQSESLREELVKEFELTEVE